MGRTVHHGPETVNARESGYAFATDVPVIRPITRKLRFSSMNRTQTHNIQIQMLVRRSDDASYRNIVETFTFRFLLLLISGILRALYKRL